MSGPLNDYICLKLTQRNHGIYEPEFRLVLMLLVVVLGTVGFFGFGASVHAVTHWSGPVLTYGFANMSLAFASTCVFGYVLDSYPKLAEEAFVAINTRNLLTFGLVSYPVNPNPFFSFQTPYPDLAYLAYLAYLAELETKSDLGRKTYRPTS